MKNLAISAALVAGLGIAAVNPAQAANDGRIDITGEITATTCSINGHQPGQGLAIVPVGLRGVPAASLPAGQTGGDKGLVIQVGAPNEATCIDGDTAYVRFDPLSPAINPATGRLINTSATGNDATNVEIQFLNVDSTGSVIDLSADDSAGYVIANHQVRIPLVARYFAYPAGATIGAVASTVGFSVVYD